MLTPLPQHINTPSSWSARSGRCERLTVPSPRSPWHDPPNTNCKGFDGKSDLHRERANTLHSPKVNKSCPLEIGKRFKRTFTEVAKDAHSGLIESKLGYYLGKAAMEHDLANIPRMPEEFLIGLNHDTVHSRTSYLALHNLGTDAARNYLPSGANVVGIQFVVAQQDPMTGEMRYTVIGPEVPNTNAYMDLLDESLEILERQNNTTSANLGFSQATQIPQAPKIPRGLQVSHADLQANKRHERDELFFNTDAVELHTSTRELQKPSSDKPVDFAGQDLPPSEPGPDPEIDDHIPVHKDQKARTWHGSSGHNPQHCPSYRSMPGLGVAKNKALPPMPELNGWFASQSGLSHPGRTGTIKSVYDTQDLVRSWDAADLIEPSTPPSPANSLHRHSSPRAKEKKKRRSAKIYSNRASAEVLQSSGRSSRKSGSDRAQFPPMPPLLPKSETQSIPEPEATTEANKPRNTFPQPGIVYMKPQYAPHRHSDHTERVGNEVHRGPSRTSGWNSIPTVRPRTQFSRAMTNAMDSNDGHRTTRPLSHKEEQIRNTVLSLTGPTEGNNHDPVRATMEKLSGAGPDLASPSPLPRSPPPLPAAGPAPQIQPPPPTMAARTAQQSSAGSNAGSVGDKGLNPPLAHFHRQSRRDAAEYEAFGPSRFSDNHRVDPAFAYSENARAKAKAGRMGKGEVLEDEKGMEKEGVEKVPCPNTSHGDRERDKEVWPGK